MVTLSADNRVVVYMGDDERGEYIYKFISDGTYAPGDRAANLRLLEHGTCMSPGLRPMGRANGWHWSTARMASMPLLASRPSRGRGASPRCGRQSGATKMDRPEWIAVHPTTKEVYCALTNNSNRGTDKGAAIDPANPRAKNVYGHIIRWREQGGDPKASRFQWDIFVLCGDPAMTEADEHGTSKGIYLALRMDSGLTHVVCLDRDGRLDQRAQQRRLR